MVQKGEHYVENDKNWMPCYCFIVSGGVAKAGRRYTISKTGRQCTKRDARINFQLHLQFQFHDGAGIVFRWRGTKIPAPVQLKNVKSLAGIHVLRISADGELGELREFETHIDIKGIYNNTLIGYTLVTPYIFDLGDEFVEVTGDSICFIDEIKNCLTVMPISLQRN